MVMSDARAARAGRDAMVSEEHVRLARLLGGGQGKGKVSERAMYYRKPPTGAEAGWIVVMGTNPERQANLFMKGFVPLHEYGFVDPQSYDHPDPSYRTWAKLLLTPGGPEEMPADQVIAYRWYDPDICPVPSARFTQLKDVSITRVWCPECENVYYHKPNHLARHLRTVHSYDRAEILAVGQELGISFAKEVLTGRRAVEEVVYEVPPEPESETMAMPLVEMEDNRPRGRRRMVEA